MSCVSGRVCPFCFTRPEFSCMILHFALVFFWFTCVTFFFGGGGGVNAISARPVFYARLCYAVCHGHHNIAASRYELLIHRKRTQAPSLRSRPPRLDRGSALYASTKIQRPYGSALVLRVVPKRTARILLCAWCYLLPQYVSHASTVHTSVSSYQLLLYIHPLAIPYASRPTRIFLLYLG